MNLKGIDQKKKKLKKFKLSEVLLMKIKFSASFP